MSDGTATGVACGNCSKGRKGWKGSKCWKSGRLIDNFQPITELRIVQIDQVVLIIRTDEMVQRILSEIN